MPRKIIVGTRGSKLALYQTQWVVQQLKRYCPEYCFKLVSIQTKGDKILDVALAKIGDKGLFTKELEVAMFDGKVDLVIHSMKDLPTVLPEGLAIGAVTRRKDPRDVLISKNKIKLDDLPNGSQIGTSSLRRRAQLLKYRPDLIFIDLRGNLTTRLTKLRHENWSAIILAAAGVKRLGLSEYITEYLDLNICLPAVGQGSLAIELREDDMELKKVVALLNDVDSERAITAERSMLRKLEGGCQIPIGSLGRIKKGVLYLDGIVADPEGKIVLRSRTKGFPEEAEKLGVELADKLIALGAGKILEGVGG